MKTIHEWELKLWSQTPSNFRELLIEFRREAFDRCELEAYRSGETGICPVAAASCIAERIFKVFKEEGKK